LHARSFYCHFAALKMTSRSRTLPSRPLIPMRAAGLIEVWFSALKTAP
jgi:hypothetical protein